VIDTYQPHEAAIEQVFVNVNPAATLMLGQARGACVSALVLRNLAVSDYTALQVKQSVVGHGKAAKEQVQHMVVRMLNLSGTPQADAADALAVALAHANLSGGAIGQLARQGLKVRGGRWYSAARLWRLRYAVDIVLTEPCMSSSPVAIEPQAADLAHHPARWWLATRPAFLSITLAGVVLAWPRQRLAALRQHWPLALLGLMLALLTHAAVNVINDVADHHNGTDAANTARLFPFTGGSRFIQNGVLSAAQMRSLAYSVCAGDCWWLVSGQPARLAAIADWPGWRGAGLGLFSAAIAAEQPGPGEPAWQCFLLLPQGMAVLLSGGWQTCCGPACRLPSSPACCCTSTSFLIAKPTGWPANGTGWCGCRWRGQARAMACW
jgi:hypothetical protein